MSSRCGLKAESARSHEPALPARLTCVEPNNERGAQADDYEIPGDFANGPHGASVAAFGTARARRVF